MTLSSRILASLLALTALLAAVPAFAFDVPPNDGFVTDTAGMITADQDTQLEKMLQDYKQQTSNQIAVVIIDSLNGEAISDVAVAIGRKWGVGTAEHNNGVLLVISKTDRQVFLAPGYGLEGVIPDIVAKGIVEKEIVPRFRDGKYFEGIQAGLDAIEKHIGGEYKADRYTASANDNSWLPWVVFVGFLILHWFAAMFAQSKSWWLGGVIGGIFGVTLTILYGWWLSIPVLVLLGLLFDYLLSKGGGGRGGRGGMMIGGWGSSGGFRSGGGGGFGGGSFGGGGAGGKW